MIEQVLKNLEFACLNKLTSDQKEAYHKWLADDAGCDLVQFVDVLGNETTEVLWELQRITEATYELRELRRLASIGDAIFSVASLLRK